jgi:NTE family protein
MKFVVYLALALALAGCVTAPPETARPVAVEPVPSTGSPTPAVVAPDLPIVARVLPRIGLALGGGAARGFAHVGVIQVLEEAGIRPSMVAGTSAGSLVASIYASGKSGLQLQRVAETMEEAAITDWTLPLFNRGMLRGDALAKYVNAQVGARLIENMPLPLGILATDLKTGQSMLFQRGDTGTAVRASSAVPALFEPVKISGREYVNGGLVSPIPVRAVRQMGADLVIAVDISSPPEGNLSGSTIDILMQTFTIMSKSINTLELRDADVVVRPNLPGVGSSDFGARKRSIEAGRKAMLQMLPQLRLAIAAKTR